jgi:hypothetical protein
MLFCSLTLFPWMPFLFQGQLDRPGTLQDGEALLLLPPKLPRQLQQQHVLLGAQIQPAAVDLNSPSALGHLQLGLTPEGSLPKTRMHK